MNLLHHIGCGIAQPDPFTAFCNAAAFGCVAVANDNAFLFLRSGRPLSTHLGARFGASLLFRARNRRPGKFFGSARHLSVLASTPCARHQMSTGVVRHDGNTFQQPGN